MLSSYWANFARNSNPNGPGLPTWPAFNPKGEYLMNFGYIFRMERFNSAGMDLITAAHEDLRHAGSGTR